jgi:hypothetical protein
MEGMGLGSGMVACPSLEEAGLLVASWCRITERRIAYMYIERMRSNQVPMYLYVVKRKGLEFSFLHKCYRSGW